MNDLYSALSYLTTFLFLISEIVLFIASLMLWTKKRSIATVIMIIASFASIFLSIGTTVFYKFIDHFGGNYEYGIGISILAGLASITFGVALLLYVMNHVKKSKGS